MMSLMSQKLLNNSQLQIIGHKKRVSYSHRTATTTYPCYVPVLGDSAGAGRERLTRGKINNNFNFKGKIK